MLVLQDKEWQVTLNERRNTGQSCPLNAKSEIPLIRGSDSALRVRQGEFQGELELEEGNFI